MKMVNLLNKAVNTSRILRKVVHFKNTARICRTSSLKVSHHLLPLPHTIWIPQNFWLSYGRFTAWFPSIEAPLVHYPAKTLAHQRSFYCHGKAEMSVSCVTKSPRTNKTIRKKLTRN